MEQVEREMAVGRAHTDASLDAERATSDTDSLVTAADARRALDDLIEYDRRIADLSLLKFRIDVDRTLSRERLDSPLDDSSVSGERDSADHSKQLERDMADTLLQGERNRSDVAVEAERNEHDALRVGLDERRRSTDDLLLTERQGADVTMAALGVTKTALAQAHTEQGRWHDVLGLVTHDLRSPLMVISMNAENITQLTGEAFSRNSAGTIARAVSRMDRLISDLLDLARIESGSMKIELRRHDVGALLLEVLRLYQPMFTGREIAFRMETVVGNVAALFDYDRIVQVLSNLLGNAMKFTQRGGTVVLRVEPQERQILFELRDNGPGISPQALPHVFERFWQIDSDVRRGLGLGLHICENIVQAHGGKIWVESEVGTGTIFRFTLPRC